MTHSLSLRLGAALALAGAAACADAPVPTEPLAPTELADARAAAAASTTDENFTYSPLLAQINTQLASSRANYRVAAAELRIAADGWTGVTSTVLLANDRQRSLGAEWVKGDPRRDGRLGVTYAFGSNTAIAPTTRDPNGANVRLVSAAEQAAYIDEAMSAWRAITCSSKPITKVAVLSAKYAVLSAVESAVSVTQMFRAGLSTGRPLFVRAAFSSFVPLPSAVAKRGICA